MVPKKVPWCLTSGAQQATGFAMVSCVAAAWRIQVTGIVTPFMMPTRHIASYLLNASHRSIVGVVSSKRLTFRMTTN